MPSLGKKVPPIALEMQSGPGCSISFINSANGMDDYWSADGPTKKKYFEDLNSIMTQVVQYEPHTFICYINSKLKKQIEWLEEYGFFVLETVPGGHSDYTMELMMFTLHPNIHVDKTTTKLPIKPDGIVVEKAKALVARAGRLGRAARV